MKCTRLRIRTKSQLTVAKEGQTSHKFIRDFIPFLQFPYGRVLSHEICQDLKNAKENGTNLNDFSGQDWESRMGLKKGTEEHQSNHWESSMLYLNFLPCVKYVLFPI